MSRARWGSLPEKRAERKPRRKTTRTSWTCGTCGDVVKSWAAAERHLDEVHDGHGRMECEGTTT